MKKSITFLSKKMEYKSYKNIIKFNTTIKTNLGLFQSYK